MSSLHRRRRLPADIGMTPVNGASLSPVRPEALTAEEAVELSAAPSGVRSARVTCWLLLIGGLAVLVLNAFTVPGYACSEAEQCGTTPVEYLLLGAMIIVPFLGWVDLGFAVVAAGAMVAALFCYGLANPARGLPLWSQLVVLGYAAGCAWVAVRAAVRRRHPEPGDTDAGCQVGERQRPPPPPRSVWPSPAVAVAATGLLAAALVTVACIDQVRSETYDASPWYVLASILGVLGLGGWWRFGARALQQRALFRRLQRVSAVFVWRDGRRVHLYPGVFNELTPPFAVLRVREGAPAVCDAPVPAVLYGTPAPGRWCTVRVDEVTLCPSGVLRPTGEDDRRKLIGRVSDAHRSADPVRVVSGRSPDRLTDLTMVHGLIVVAALLAICVVVETHREYVLDALITVLCTDGRCNRYVMAVTGWAAIAGPMLLMGAVLHAGRFGRRNQVAAVGCVLLLGASVAFVVSDYRHVPPAPFMLGWVVALAALCVGVRVGKWTEKSDPLMPIVVADAVQLVALSGLLIWVAAS